jgi:hypothetical protein
MIFIAWISISRDAPHRRPPAAIQRMRLDHGELITHVMFAVLHTPMGPLRSFARCRGTGHARVADAIVRAQYYSSSR